MDVLFDGLGVAGADLEESVWSTAARTVHTTAMSS